MPFTIARRCVRAAGPFAFAAAALAAPAALAQQPDQEIPPPPNEPAVVRPGTANAPPSDAIVLFDGTDTARWKASKDGGPVRWKVDSGVLEVVPKTGDIVTTDTFEDIQLHIEFATPEKVEGEGQGRGNSGIFLQERYEVQVLDSFQNPTYFHGQAASIYKQHAPLVNASRKPGEWQVYDIVFRAPRFDGAGKVTRPARITIFHNGVLVQDHAEVFGSTTNRGAPKYVPHGPGGIRLQDHSNPMRFRNIWVRKL